MRQEPDALSFSKPFLTIPLTIKNRRGLHARAAAKLVKTIETYQATVFIFFENKQVLGTSIMGLMFLGATMGDKVNIQASGPQAKEALQAVKELIDNKFFED